VNPVVQIGAAGMKAQERALSVAANNITNMNTAGFKRSRVRFGEMVTPQSTGEPTARAFGAGSGVAALGATVVFDQGDLRASGNAMDVAIDGRGFIEVLGPEGQSLLWRGGSLSIRRDGLLATSDGLPLRALITVPDAASEIRIERDGTVTALVGGDETPTELGRIDLVGVMDASSLEATGSGLYRLAEGVEPAPAVPGEDGIGTIVQGAVEASNVLLAEEMVGLMLMQRAYAASAQALQAGDQLMSIANGLRR